MWILHLRTTLSDRLPFFLHLLTLDLILVPNLVMAVVLTLFQNLAAIQWVCPCFWLFTVAGHSGRRRREALSAATAEFRAGRTLPPRRRTPSSQRRAPRHPWICGRTGDLVRSMMVAVVIGILVAQMVSLSFDLRFEWRKLNGFLEEDLDWGRRT